MIELVYCTAMAAIIATAVYSYKIYMAIADIHKDIKRITNILEHKHDS